MPPHGSNMHIGMTGLSVMQAELPNSQSNKIIQPLRALKNRQTAVPLGQGPPDGAPGASTRLCAYLNDMRELRTKQGELTAAFKACVPPAWWGTDAGFKSQLGDRFKMCQVYVIKHSLDVFCIVAIMALLLSWQVCNFLFGGATVTKDCTGISSGWGTIFPSANSNNSLAVLITELLPGVKCMLYWTWEICHTLCTMRPKLLW